MKRKLAVIRSARAKVEKEEARVAAMTRELARTLTAEMSVRDASEILGVSHARVQQLVEK